MTFEQQWLEYDYNPFVVFNSNGKIISLNSEAQFLLGSINPAELFELAQAYASISFGFKTSFLDLEYGRYKFFALTVGYEDENQIGIKLYQSPSFKLNTVKPEGELTNIFTLTDLCISTNSISSPVKYTKNYDPTIPDIIINSNKFIKVLNKMYACVQENETIDTKVFYRIGEHIKFEDKKYSIFSISVDANNIDKTKSSELKNFAEANEFHIEVGQSLTLNIPMITD
ncbi:hypothetical protein GJV85_06250 [Sulfurimonas aquatica]|uniref:Uncharacterized protein n=1 Tax=Sulfurimonas aquatica TaxID=2672570 RepID=A0A975GCW0_9BACT|nr:hypothetical protein [Sulfurimonas aquatica]QSZ41723.1 hypothetical protein GJV85_06250 [Sulfurimonas aquatica]